MRLRWTARSLADLDDLQAHIAFDRPIAARRQAELIVNAVETLSAFPEMGRPGRHRGSRELVIVGIPFVVAYRARGDEIEILAIRHGRRRWLRSFGP